MGRGSIPAAAGAQRAGARRPSTGVIYARPVRARPARRLSLVVLAVALVAIAAAGGVMAGNGALLALAPFACLLVPLLCGRYIGERVLERARLRDRPRRRPIAAVLAIAGPGRLPAAGDALIASCRAERAPPAPLAVA